MGDMKLYKHTHIGTKDLIEVYISSALDTMTALLDISAKSGCNSMESKHILEQVLSARQAFGRSALLLSGGATFGMNHIGVLKALWKAHLLPRIISGASAGSIVCAVLCTRTDEEMPELLANFCHGDLAVFEEEGNEDGVLRKAARFLKFGALFDISHLIRVMKDLLGDMTFQEAYNRTRRILNICVSSASLYELPRLLNYVTAPNVLIWSAVAASCSVPFIFSAASLLAKDPKTGEAVPWNPSPQRWIDGSVDNDIPMTRLAEMFNVNHFIVSQVNPHVVPFLVKEEDSIAAEAQQSTSTVACGPTWLHSMTSLAKGEALHRMHVMAELGIFPNTLTKAVSVLSQKYSGDITIFPEISYTDFPRMLKNPTTEFMQQAMLCGERATWPKMSRIRNHCAIELALDDAVQKLRARVVFSPSQVDLRVNKLPRSNSATNDRFDIGRGRGSRWPKRIFQSSEPIDSAVKESTVNRNPRPRPTHIKTQSDEISPRTGESTTSFHSLRPVHQKVPNTSLLIIPPLDLTSSGAETSTATVSESDDIESSSTSSPESPSSPSIPTLWPSTRQLFPFASQPTTPATSQNRLGFFSPLTANPISQSPIAANAPQTTQSNTLSMTPKEIGPSNSPELRYQKLFHQNAGPQAFCQEPAASMASAMLKKQNGLTIDISGTRGMMRRKKSSSSVNQLNNEILKK
ncbi:MAG: hypothetical protein M1830_005291 [Pleopsidium flavum]|nr:MAG: hypothetical protein M1830_005291 [Pleopsidium flavum]